MSYDYLMRQIEEATRVVAGAIFKKKETETFLFDASGNFLEDKLLLVRLKDLVSKGNVNEAETLLFDTIKEDARFEYLQIALDFYELLSASDNAFLENSNFSREEIQEGVAEICEIYNI